MEKSKRYLKLVRLIEENQLEKYRLRQILDNIYKGKIVQVNNMKNIPSNIRRKLKSTFSENILSIKPLKEYKYDRAYKVLFQCKDKEKIEATSLDFGSHKSLCISSQIGCSFACKFCATGKIGIKRQLEVDEITDQLLYFQSKQVNIKNVSFMGMGEPLANPYVFDAIQFFNHIQLFSISNRRINVSTVGLLPGIKKLNDLFPQVNLSFSLHSPFSDERDKLVPINRLFPFHEVLDLLDERIGKTGRRVWISYILIKDINDSKDHAEALCDHIRKRPSAVRYLYNVCLIPYNKAKNVDENFHRLVEEEKIHQFEKILRKHGISFFYRNSFGHSIDAACGQLYADYEPKKGKDNISLGNATMIGQ
ncbi:Fe-S-cluster redox enzyme, putative [Plasmodium ovale wallikeri]|uniref:Fe-S-cluster redox enzyme, putative n=2 Tax=Plasmodium ovale TaxID=36330 RepID=A0A1A8ZT52_PLAOA|nr:Fe-S-cluster redox enzyme, putative [Plasmodium ovale wallikeri]SBT47008.1 Fe-S-cluster redox enzyme, putative [Plasmodium ovale wallikeri]SBT78997.1 radical SAM protein, putative [Plasmodium ovale]